MLLQAAMDRPRQQILAAQKESRTQAQQDAEAIRGWSTALANLLQNKGADVDKVYADAATREQRIGEGFAQGQQKAEQGSADEANALLSSQGQDPRIHAGPASQVTYALGGAMPAHRTNETGAAFSALAHLLPGTAVGRGQHDMLARLALGQKEQSKLRGDMEDLNARAPGMLNDILDRLYQREISKSATGTQRDYLGVSQDRLNLDAATQIDPNTGVPYSVETARDKTLAGKSSDVRKQTLAARKARVGALSSAHENSYQLAAQLYKGTKVKSRDGITMVVQRPTRQEAYRDLYLRYGKPLEHLAPKGARNWWLRQIDAMVKGALDYAGWPKPPPKPPRNRKITRPGPS